MMIIIINVTYMSQIRIDAANAPSRLLQAFWPMSSKMFSAVHGIQTATYPVCISKKP